MELYYIRHSLSLKEFQGVLIVVGIVVGKGVNSSDSAPPCQYYDFQVWMGEGCSLQNQQQFQ